MSNLSIISATLVNNRWNATFSYIDVTHFYIYKSLFIKVYINTIDVATQNMLTCLFLQHYFQIFKLHFNMLKEWHLKTANEHVFQIKIANIDNLMKDYHTTITTYCTLHDLPLKKWVVS